jgi:hypothetical protein
MAHQPGRRYVEQRDHVFGEWQADGDDAIGRRNLHVRITVVELSSHIRFAPYITSKGASRLQLTFIVEAIMAKSITNYDGSIVVSPQQVVYPQTVEEIQKVLRDPARYPSPVRGMGSYHSLTPCASSEGTVVNMTRMTRVIAIDKANGTLTAEAGLQFIHASEALRAQDLQFMTNIEIGNMTLGSAACCHSKDALDGIEFGQVSSYVTKIKWVTPAGDLAEASEKDSPDLLRMVRSSYGLVGIVYEVTFRMKPIEAIHFTYLPRPVDELTQQEVEHLIDSAEGLVCWTVGRTSVFQTRQRVAEPNILGSLLAAVRRRLWNNTSAHGAHFIDQFISDRKLRQAAQEGTANIANLLYPRFACSAASRCLRRIRRSTTAERGNTPDTLSPSGLFRAPNGWRRCVRISTSPTNISRGPDSAATCLWALISFERTRARYCHIARMATHSRSTRFMPVRTTLRGTISSASSTTLLISARGNHC